MTFSLLGKEEKLQLLAFGLDSLIRLVHCMPHKEWFAWVLSSLHFRIAMLSNRVFFILNKLIKLG